MRAVILCLSLALTGPNVADAQTPPEDSGTRDLTPYEGEVYYYSKGQVVKGLPKAEAPKKVAKDEWVAYRKVVEDVQRGKKVVIAVGVKAPRGAVAVQKLPDDRFSPGVYDCWSENGGPVFRLRAREVVAPRPKAAPQARTTTRTTTATPAATTNLGPQVAVLEYLVTPTPAPAAGILGTIDCGPFG